MPFGSGCFEIAQIMPVAIKGNPSRINELAGQIENAWARKSRLYPAISRTLPTVHRSTAYYRLSSEFLPRTIAAYTEQAREQYGKDAVDNELLPCFAFD